MSFRAARPATLSRLLPEGAGEHVLAALQAIGIRFSLRSLPKSVLEQDGRVEITLASGETHVVDHVIAAIGLQPRTALASKAGLATTRGIAVDRMLRTSDPHVYALGDCAEVEGHLLPFVAPILNAVCALAQTLSGQPTPVVYPPMPGVVKTPACPMVVASPPWNAEGVWEVRRSDNGVRAPFSSQAGELLGFALVGEAVREKNALTTALPLVLA